MCVCQWVCNGVGETEILLFCYHLPAEYGGWQLLWPTSAHESENTEICSVEALKKEMERDITLGYFHSHNSWRTAFYFHFVTPKLLNLLT